MLLRMMWTNTFSVLTCHTKLQFWTINVKASFFDIFYNWLTFSKSFKHLLQVDKQNINAFFLFYNREGVEQLVTALSHSEIIRTMSNSLNLATRRKLWSWLFFRFSPKMAHRSHSLARSLETGNIVGSLCNTFVTQSYLLGGKLPFLQETDGILQGFVLLLQLLVAIVKHLKSLSISVGNICSER